MCKRTGKYHEWLSCNSMRNITTSTSGCRIWCIWWLKAYFVSYGCIYIEFLRKFLYFTSNTWYRFQISFLLLELNIHIYLSRTIHKYSLTYDNDISNICIRKGCVNLNLKAIPIIIFTVLTFPNLFKFIFTRIIIYMIHNI